MHSAAAVGVNGTLYVAGGCRGLDADRRAAGNGERALAAVILGGRIHAVGGI
jgi:hypothetical protein